MMKILGIDTILHDACAAVTENNKVLSNVNRHTPMSLVNQSLLSLTEVHVREIGEVLRNAFNTASVSIDDISLVAVNNSGSLLSNVLIGLIAANTISAVKDIPIVDVSHQEGHIFSNWIETEPIDFCFPILVFSASGGHNLTALLKRDDFKFNILSESKGIKKDSKVVTEFVGIGFLFSKIVFWLGLDTYREGIGNDGSLVARLAKRGDAKRFILSPKTSRIFLELSLKNLMKNVHRLIKRERRWGRRFDDKFIFDMTASFESSLAEIITDYLCYMGQMYKVKEIHLVGGVSANEIIRHRLIAKTKIPGIRARYPKRKSYCTDNAAMIANAGYYKFIRNNKKYVNRRHLNINSDLALERLAIDQVMKISKRLD